MIKILPLGNHQGDVFTSYFESLAFEHAPEWSGCFCRFYHTDCDDNTWMNRTGEENKLEARDAIHAGQMKGYLAFDNQEVVGWVNANDAKTYLRLLPYLQDQVPLEKTAIIICFVIHPDYRGQGIASQMIDKIVADYRALGYERIISLPVRHEGESHSERHYRGSENMYKRAGFKAYKQVDSVTVMMIEL